MQVELINISKKFQNHAIFSGVNMVLPTGYKGVLLGGNGSGKSTLIKIISGALTPSTGSVILTDERNQISSTEQYKYLAFCAPYTDLIEDFTLTELLAFQAQFKPFVAGISPREIIDLLDLKKFQHRPIRMYSSGMKQRVKLALTVLCNVPIVLLDEPTSNLDPTGRQWYKQLIETFIENRTLIVASNFLEEEYFFANAQITLADYQ